MTFPEAILAEHVFPYIDRVTLNRATVTCHNVLAAEHHRMKRENTNLPWPSGCYVSSDGYKKSTAAVLNDQQNTKSLSDDTTSLIRQRLQSNPVARASLWVTGEKVSFSPDGSILGVSSAKTGKIFIYNVREGLVQIISDGEFTRTPCHKIVFAKERLNGIHVRRESVIDRMEDTEGPILASYCAQGLTRFYTCNDRCNANDEKQRDKLAQFSSIKSANFEHQDQNEATVFVSRETVYHSNQDRLKRTSSFCVSMDTGMMVSANWMDLETYSIWNLNSENKRNAVEPRMFPARPFRQNISNHNNNNCDDNDCVITAVGISPDASTIASGGSDGSLCLALTENGKHIATLSKACSPWKVLGDVVFASNGEHVAAIHYWTYQTRFSQKIRIWSDNSGGCPSSRMLSGSRSSEDISKANQLGQRTKYSSFSEKVLQHHNVDITCLCFSPNSKYIVGGCAHMDYSLLIWSVASGLPMRIIKGPGIVSDLAVSVTAGAVAAGCHNETFCLWTLQEVFPSSNSTSLKTFQRDEDSETTVEECRYF